jgi:hypothetical protein
MSGNGTVQMLEKWVGYCKKCTACGGQYPSLRNPRNNMSNLITFQTPLVKCISLCSTVYLPLITSIKNIVIISNKTIPIRDENLTRATFCSCVLQIGEHIMTSVLLCSIQD